MHLGYKLKKKYAIKIKKKLFLHQLYTINLLIYEFETFTIISLCPVALMVVG